MKSEGEGEGADVLECYYYCYDYYCVIEELCIRH